MRLYQISFACGLAAGYVLGAKAGRERYDQIVKNAKGFAEHPVVRQAAQNVQSAAAGAVKSASRMAAAKGGNRMAKMSQRRRGTAGASGRPGPMATGKQHKAKAEPGSDRRPSYTPASGDFELP